MRVLGLCCYDVVKVKEIGQCGCADFSRSAEAKSPLRHLHPASLPCSSPAPSYQDAWKNFYKTSQRCA